MKIGDFGLGWFDFAVVIILLVGVLRGRSRGMSVELLDVLKWLIIVTVGALVYRPMGLFIAEYTHLPPSTGYVAAYFAVIVILRLVIGWIKHMVGEKLVGSDVFGAGEYYLGMLAGAVRFTCYLVAALALLNADYVSPEQLAANARMQQENFGDISFPTIGSLQQNVFNGSISGQFVKKYLAQQLIVSTLADKSAKPVETLGRRQERAIYEVLGEKK